MKRFFLLLGFPLLALGCTASEFQQAVTIAEDVTKIAEVLCLADQAKKAGKDAMSMGGLCSTAEQLAPYVAVAQGQVAKAACP